MRKNTSPFSLLIVIVLFTSCREAQDNGGGCDYNTAIFPAKVVSIIPLDSPWYDLKLIVPKSTADTDTLSYIRETKDYLTARRIEELGIVIGNEYTYKVMDITRGHCTPHITVLKLEAFRK